MIRGLIFATAVFLQGLPAVTVWRPPPPLGGRFAVLRQCESTDNYGIRSPGEPDGGAYQWAPKTWRSFVDAATLRNYPTPADAPYWVQDWWTFHLWLAQGRYPWPHCGLVAGL